VLSRTWITVIEFSGVGFASGRGLKTPKCAGAVMERYYAVKEIAGMLGLSADMVRRIFANEPGVLDFRIVNKKAKSRGRNRLLRIPESVLRRVCEQRTIRLKGLNLDREFRKIQERYPLQSR
jgi:hypothetical protein